MPEKLIQDVIDLVNRALAPPKEIWVTLKVARQLGIQDDEGELVQTEHGWFRRVVRNGTEVYIPAELKT